MDLIEKVFNDLNELHAGVVNLLLHAPEEYVDLSKYPTIYSYNNFIRTRTCKFDMDLGSLGLTKSRWCRFLTQYVENHKLHKWIDSIADQRGAVVNLFKSYGETHGIPDLNHPETEGHRWGNCFLGISFRKGPKPTLTLYSRAARLPTTAVMELALVSNLAEIIKEKYSLREDPHFVWYVSVIHLGAFDCIPYLTFRGELEEFCNGKEKLAGFIKSRAERMTRLPATREAMPYGRMRRVAARMKEFQSGKMLPVVMTSTLDVFGGKTP